MTSFFFSTGTDPPKKDDSPKPLKSKGSLKFYKTPPKKRISTEGFEFSSLFQPSKLRPSKDKEKQFEQQIHKCTEPEDEAFAFNVPDILIVQRQLHTDSTIHPTVGSPEEPFQMRCKLGFDSPTELPTDSSTVIPTAHMAGANRLKLKRTPIKRSLSMPVDNRSKLTKDAVPIQVPLALHHAPLLEDTTVTLTHKKLEFKLEETSSPKQQRTGRTDSTRHKGLVRSTSGAGTGRDDKHSNVALTAAPLLSTSVPIDKRSTAKDDRMRRLERSQSDIETRGPKLRSRRLRTGSSTKSKKKIPPEVLQHLAVAFCHADTLFKRASLLELKHVWAINTPRSKKRGSIHVSSSGEDPPVSALVQSTTERIDALLDESYSTCVRLQCVLLSFKESNSNTDSDKKRRDSLDFATEEFCACCGAKNQVLLSTKVSLLKANIYKSKAKLLKKRQILLSEADHYFRLSCEIFEQLLNVESVSHMVLLQMASLYALWGDEDKSQSTLHCWENIRSKNNPYGLPQLYFEEFDAYRDMPWFRSIMASIDPNYDKSQSIVFGPQTATSETLQQRRFVRLKKNKTDPK